IGELRGVGLPIGSIIINMARQPLLPVGAMERAASDRLDATAIAASLSKAGLDGPSLAAPLLLEAAEHARGWQSQQLCRSRIGDLGRLTYELPELQRPIDIGSLYELADVFTQAGVR
ncbi:MAG: ATPase, partial [Actinomycetota bacterium]|nr:ATPase [Actinomycetota bacterium]